MNSRFDSTFCLRDRFLERLHTFDLAFVGFEVQLYPPGEAKRPERDMPLGLLLGLENRSNNLHVDQLVSQARLYETGRKVVVHYGCILCHFWKYRSSKF